MAIDLERIRFGLGFCESFSRQFLSVCAVRTCLRISFVERLWWCCGWHHSIYASIWFHWRQHTTLSIRSVFWFFFFNHKLTISIWMNGIHIFFGVFSQKASLTIGTHIAQRNSSAYRFIVFLLNGFCFACKNKKIKKKIKTKISNIWFVCHRSFSDFMPIEEKIYANGWHIWLVSLWMKIQRILFLIENENLFSQISLRLPLLLLV